MRCASSVKRPPQAPALPEEQFDLSRHSILARDVLVFLVSRCIPVSEMQTKSILGSLSQRLIAAFQYERPTRDIKRDSDDEDLWSVLGHAKYKCLIPGAIWARRRNRGTRGL